MFDRQEWRKANLETVRGYRKRERARHGAIINARTAAWRAANPDKVREYSQRYAKANKEARRLNESHRRARKRNAGGSYTHQEWVDKCSLLGNVCFYCGEAKRLGPDHKIPLSRGGSDEITNIVPSCGSCNERKHTKTAREFLGLAA